ncbi:MAG: type II secretion system minor pseudopilin GspK [Nitrospiria bacterium]
MKRGVLKNQNGFALILSLLILLLLVVIVLETNFYTRTDLRAAGNFRDDLKAFYLARSAVSAGQAILKDDARTSARYDGLDELWAFPIPEYSLGDGTLSGSIVDEEGKINLNRLVDAGSGRVNEARSGQLRLLFELLEIKTDLVDPVIDWIDADSETISPFGAEEGYYLGLDPPYSAKNGPLDTLSELHMVKGMTDDIYRKIEPYVTVYGAGQININTADPLVLQSLDRGIDESEAGRLIRKRPFESPAQFKEHLLADVKVRMTTARSINWIKTRSNIFLLTAEGKVHDTRKIAHAVIQRNGAKTKLLYFRVE